MQKYFILLVISVILFSCKKEEKDDSYNYLNDKLDEFVNREENTLNDIYYKIYNNTKEGSLERKRFDSLNKISTSIDEKLKLLNFSDRKKALKFRDSVAKVYGISIMYSKENDDKNLNDSVFKKMIKIEILRLKGMYHGMYIHRHVGFKY